MQILTLRSWSNAFDFEQSSLHIRETQLMICSASCAVSHWGFAGSTALTQTCAARDRDSLSSLLFFLFFFSHCLTALDSHLHPNRTSHQKQNFPFWIHEFRPIRLQSKKREDISPACSRSVFCYAVRGEVSLWQLLTPCSSASCLNVVGPVSILTERNTPSGLKMLWKWQFRKK